MSAEQAPEPTMDEILASIRRIISDEPTEHVDDVQGNSVQSQLSQTGQNLGGVTGSSVADDIARALTAGPKTAEVREDQPPKIEEDIFQLTDDQVAVTDEQLPNPVQEMEKVLQEKDMETSSGIAEPSVGEVDEEIGLSEFKSDEDLLVSDSQMQQHTAQFDSPDIDPAQGVNNGGGPEMKDPVSHFSDSHEVQLEIGGEKPAPIEESVDLHKAQRAAEFDPEIGTDLSASSEELIPDALPSANADLSNLDDGTKSVSPEFDKSEIGLDLSDVDNLFSNETGVSSTDINEANEILSGTAETVEGLVGTSSIEENLQFSGDLDLEPPALASAVVSDVEQPGKGMENDHSLGSLEENSDKDVYENQPIMSELSTEPLPELELGQDLSETDSDILSSLAEQADQQSESEFTDKSEVVSPVLTEPPGLLNQARTEESLDQAQASVNTFEQGIKDMLRPMIQSWLDANLPRLVEGAIKDEINLRRDDDSNSGV